MKFVRKNLKHIIVLVSIFFILQVSLLFYNKYYGYTSPDFTDLLQRYLAVMAVYALLFYQVYHLRKTKQALSILKEILVLAATVSLFILIPVLYAIASGIITNEAGYLYVLEVNMLFALLLSITAYLTKHLSYGLSKAVFLISINTVFVINCAAIAIFYSTGFEIGPTVFLHFSWDAVMVGAGEYQVMLLIMLAILIPVNVFFMKIIKGHKDSVVNYTIVSLAVLTVLANSIILNYDSYKTKLIFPVYSILDTAIRYSNSNALSARDKYISLDVDKRETDVLKELGINLGALATSRNVVQPSEKINLITIYLEAFQLNFTKHGKELYPGLTPTLNALSDDYVIYKNFINSVTPTINAMISSQCGVDLILNTQFIEANNDVLREDAVAQDYLFQDNLVCLSDILHDAGYYQVMMKGAEMTFSSKGTFFKSHNYDETLGQSQLNVNEKYSELNLWGLQDPMLMDEALLMLDTLKDKQPFNLTFLTVNSHPPGFEFSECPVYEAGNTMLNGIHCTDFTLGRFLTKLRQLDIYNNTVVVIAGDHVMFNSIANNRAFKGIPLSWYGRTFLAIRSPDKSLTQAGDVFGITPDLAPTMLDLLGFKNMSFISGNSLISKRRTHQRIAANGFDIIDGAMIPERVNFILNECTIADASNEKIYDTSPLNKCQRAKIHYLQQKAVYQSFRSKK